MSRCTGCWEGGEVRVSVEEPGASIAALLSPSHSPRVCFLRLHSESPQAESSQTTGVYSLSILQARCPRSVLLD